MLLSLRCSSVPSRICCSCFVSPLLVGHSGASAAKAGVALSASATAVHDKRPRTNAPADVRRQDAKILLVVALLIIAPAPTLRCPLSMCVLPLLTILPRTLPGQDRTLPGHESS